MRKLLLMLLLATTAATPALAQRTDREEREAAREERKSERSDRAAAREAPAPRPDRGDARESRADARQERIEQRSTNVSERDRPTLEERRATRDTAVQQRAETREDRQQARQDRADTRSQWQQLANQARVRARPPVGARPDRPAPPPVEEARGAAPQWHDTWRHDDRYDWRRWRDRNRSLFHLGFYFDPFGWDYHRWGIGWRLWPSYYDRSYWLNDPWMYRLPYAPWPYQWIRYWDDAFLVNTITGRVVDVEYNFFW